MCGQRINQIKNPSFYNNRGNGIKILFIWLCISIMLKKGDEVSSPLTKEIMLSTDQCFCSSVACIRIQHKERKVSVACFPPNT